jgi:tRNA threonylcarbamoyladenosine biosynthesis protein TsaB
MIILLDTSSSLCKLTIIDDNKCYSGEWQADRGLAKGLLSYLAKIIEQHSMTWSDIAAIGVFKGPGSFTGLRIGLTVMNTIADSLAIPIVGGRGEKWQDIVLAKLHAGQNEKIVLPFYGSDVNITTSLK